MTDLLPAAETGTQDLTPYRTAPPVLRRPAAGSRVYQPDPLAETTVINRVTGEPYHLPPMPSYVPVGQPGETWIGELQEPSTGPIPTPGPAPMPSPESLMPSARRPEYHSPMRTWGGKKGARRLRTQAPWWYHQLVGAGAMALVLSVAALAVIR